MSNGKPQWLNVGEILVSKKNSLYVKIKQDVTLPAGTQLMIQDPRVKVQEAVDAGRLTEEQGEERLAKIPSFVKYNLVLPPAKD
jgi:hypothetical protein